MPPWLDQRRQSSRRQRRRSCIPTKATGSERHRISQELRAIRDEQLDTERQLASGTMTAEPRIERVLIGHMKSHQGSIEATIS
jgi:hypothetical protein